MNARCPFEPHVVGDPVDTRTGAVLDMVLDFRLLGPIELWWQRYYNSSQHDRLLALGRGQTHEFDRTLVRTGDSLELCEPVGLKTAFPAPKRDGESQLGQGARLERVNRDIYRVHRTAQPALEFCFTDSKATAARLGRIFKDEAEIAFEYSDDQWLTGIVDSAGRRLVVDEDSSGRVYRVQLEEPNSAQRSLLIAYQYDQAGCLVKTLNGQGHGYTLAYDRSHRLVRKTGRKGFSFSFQYNRLGQCVYAAGEDRSDEARLKYTVPGRITEVTRADGGVWQYIFDEAGALVQILSPLGGATQFVRNEQQGLVAEIDPLGNKTTYVRDATGEAIGRIVPSGHYVPLPEDPNYPDPLYHWVACNALEYQWGALLDLVAPTLPTSVQLDAMNLPSAVKELVQTRTAPPNRSQQAKPLGVEWWPTPARQRIFNDLGKLVEQQNDRGEKRTWTYDASGNVSSFRDFDGLEWRYDTGRWHWRLAETNPFGATIGTQYTAYGKLASFIDALGTASEYAYDQADNLVEVKRGGVVRERYVRDCCGNLVQKLDGDGQLLLEFAIGPANQPVKRTLASGDAHLFEYDDRGRYRKVGTDNDAVELAYDEFGNCKTELRNGLGIEQAFYDWNRPMQSTVLGKFQILYRHPKPGETEITDPTGGKHTLRTYGDSLIECRYANGQLQYAQYDDSGRCLFKHWQGRNGRAATQQFHWSGEGDLLEAADSETGTTRYQYDRAHRLLRQLLPGGEVSNFSFDAANNLLSQPGLGQAELAAANTLKAADGERFEYDRRGHIARRASGQRETLYQYDSDDQLIRADIDGQHWQADYDALGRRTRKRWKGGTTEYYWDGDRLAAEILPDGCVRIYIYASSLALSPLMFVDYESNKADAGSGACYFIESNQIGACTSIRSLEGKLVWQARYEPFGHAEVTSTLERPFSLRFPGHYWDDELALCYNRFRCYDPKLGRYIQSDPWGIAGGQNLYAYFPNPLARVDVRGLGEENTPSKPKRRQKKSAEEQALQDDINAGMDLGLIDSRKRGTPSGYAPNVEDWISKGGTVKMDYREGMPVTTYTRADGVSVTYYNGHPDFTPHASAPASHPDANPIVVLPGGQQGNHTTDFTNANREAGLPGSKPPEGYTWHHHEDGKTMVLVPTSIHNAADGGFPHAGGVSGL